MTRTNEQSRPKASRGPDAEKDWVASAARLQGVPQELIMDWATWAAKIWAGPYGPTVKLLLAKGCKPLPLLQLMEPCSSGWGYLSTKRKDELDDLKKRRVALARRLESDVKHLDALTWQIFLIDRDSSWRFPAHAAVGLRSVMAELQTSKELVAQLRDRRRTEHFFSISLLWFYCHAACRAATGGKVSGREIADLVNAARQSDRHKIVYENGLRMVMQRFKQSSSEIYDSTKAWTEQYVADCPDGQQTICEWSMQHPFEQFSLARSGLVVSQLPPLGVRLPHPEFLEEYPPQPREFCIELHSAEAT